MYVGSLTCSYLSDVRFHLEVNVVFDDTSSTNSSTSEVEEDIFGVHTSE